MSLLPDPWCLIIQVTAPSAIAGREPKTPGRSIVDETYSAADAPLSKPSAAMRTAVYTQVCNED